MDYKTLDELLRGRIFPVAAVNEYDENVVIVSGVNKNMGEFYKLTVAQKNGWCRIITYYEDGTCEEEYERSV